MTSQQEPINVTPGGMPCRVYEWLLKDFEAFHGPKPWPCPLMDKFYMELGLLIRFAESLEWKQEDKR